MYMIRMKIYISDYGSDFKISTRGTDETSFNHAESDLLPEIYVTEDKVLNKIINDGWEIDKKVTDENGKLISFTTKPITIDWCDRKYIEVELVPLVKVTAKFETDATKYLVKKTRVYTRRYNTMLVGTDEIVLPYVCIGPKSIKAFAKNYLKSNEIDEIGKKEKYITTKPVEVENKMYTSYYDEYTFFRLLDALEQQKTM